MIIIRVINVTIVISHLVTFSDLFWLIDDSNINKLADLCATMIYVMDEL